MSAANPFWTYSLALYDQEALRETCLRLQDEGGFDINLLLFCLWYGHCRGRLGEDVLARAVTVSGEWQSIAVSPLRGVRRQLKDWRPGLDESRALVTERARLRERVKALELQAERCQQDMLFELAEASSPEPVPGPEAQACNLRGLSRIQGSDDERSRDALARLQELASRAEGEAD